MPPSPVSAEPAPSPGPAGPGSAASGTAAEHPGAGGTAAAGSAARWLPAGLLEHRDRVVTAAVAAVALTAYLRSLMPGIGFSGDAAKWQTLSEVGGTPHATGYPLYVALIQAFGNLIPHGSAAWRTNLFSALAAVAALAVLYRLLRILGTRPGVAAAAALTFGFTVTFWTQAVIAEVYTLHLLFLVSILACMARWRLGGANGWLLAAVGLLALAFGHHLTTLLLLPSLGWLVARDWRRAVTWRTGLWVVVAGAASASQYLYLLYMTRVGGYVESPVHDLAGIRDLVSGGYFRDDMFAFTPGELVQERLSLLWRLLRHEYGVLLVPAVLGLVSAGRHLVAARRAPAGAPVAPAERARTDVVVAVGLLGLASAAYGLNYDVPDVVVFFLPLFLALAVFLGLGLEAAVRWAQDRWPGRRIVALVAGGALVAMPLVTGLVDYPRASQRGTVTAQQRIERALDAIGDHAVILTDGYDDSEFYWYYLLAEGLGRARDLDVAHAATPEQVEDYFSAGTGPVAHIAERAAGPGEDPPRLVTSSAEQATAMAGAGLVVTEVGGGVWRIDAPAG